MTTTTINTFGDLFSFVATNEAVTVPTLARAAGWQHTNAMRARCRALCIAGVLCWSADGRTTIYRLAPAADVAAERVGLNPDALLKRRIN